ncbi:helix-turn-helix domain-containing protein [Methylomonas sp. EFPC3]|uniref:helix-turn-helix domain-containing protein n=1 Tax=Methylomonas sp. EFPC3 TaxID=3021710 RepID=UPI002415A9CF|nr:helix-turn-helix domain-containing protein [Methylomonas sp. EFPC3]WFP49282.1 helix-turn-helix domain-containing protein [Methylomonas sp. EFPC3]
MTELSAPFAPDWVSPPGETILDLIEERGWTQVELAKRLGYTEKHISQLINGKVPLTDDAALRLERVLGSSAGFWLAREAKYREHSARLEAERMYENSVQWLNELPIKELIANGAIPKIRNDVKNRLNLVDACLRFFGVASPEEWRNYYGGMQVAFRRSRAEQSDIGAISAWLRLGELQAEKLDGPKYDKTRFESTLKVIRGLTRESPEIFEPQLRKLLSEAGVIFVLVPSIPRAHVSGVARWLSPTRPMIQLSLYGKTNDKFWFTLFHEAAHILLHANTKEEKKSVFLDDPNTSHTDNPQEHEANQWSGDWLIPSCYASSLGSLRSKTAVETFAQEIGIHPGIVVGRLQHDGVIDPSWMNELKTSFRFKQETNA